MLMPPISSIAWLTKRSHFLARPSSGGGAAAAPPATSAADTNTSSASASVASSPCGSSTGGSKSVSEPKAPPQAQTCPALHDSAAHFQRAGADKHTAARGSMLAKSQLASSPSRDSVDTMPWDHQNSAAPGLSMAGSVSALPARRQRQRRVGGVFARAPVSATGRLWRNRSSPLCRRWLLAR